MPRLPVVAIVREAYQFAFQHLGAVIGLIWVPMLVMSVTGFFAAQRYYNNLIDALASGNAANLGPSILMVLGYLVAALLLYAVMIVSVTQLALGQRQGGAMAHFSFGALEWRTFRALSGLVGLALLMLLTLMIAGSALLSASGGAKGSQAMDGMLLMLLLYGMIVAGAPRFLMLLAAVSVAETEPALRRSWALSAGNFWRLLGVLVAVFVPVLVLFAGAEMALAGQAAPIDSSSDKMLMISSLMRARQVLPLVSGLSFLFAPVLIALYCSASVSAWRILTGAAPAAAD